MTNSNQTSTWKNSAYFRIFFIGMGWLFIILGGMAFLSGIANYGQDGNIFQLIMYLLLLIICITGNQFVFRRIALTYGYSYMREKIRMDVDDLNTTILRSIEKMNDSILSPKIFPSAKNIKLESGIEIAFGNRGPPTYGWVSLKPYSNQYKSYLEHFSMIIDNEIIEYK